MTRTRRRGVWEAIEAMLEDEGSAEDATTSS